MGVLKDHLALRGVERSLDLVGHLLRLEVHRVADVLLTLQNVTHCGGRPFARVVRVVAPGVARPLKLNRPWRGDVLLRKHPGDFPRPVPGKAEGVDLPDHRRGFLVDGKCAVLALDVAVGRVTGQRLAAHALGLEYGLDLFARVPHHPFVK